MNIEGQSIPVESTPRPFQEIPGLWLQLGKMTDAFFAGELSHASAANTIYSILTLAVVSTTLSVVQALLKDIINYSTASTATQPAGLATLIGSMTLILCCLGLVITPISFYLNNGITYLGALIFGGRGKFTSQAYLGSLFFVPLSLISSLAAFLSLIPQVGQYISYAGFFGVSIFHIFFTVRSVKAAHNLTTGKAVAAVLSPLALLLIPICMITILLLMGPAIGNVFSKINSSLGTPMP
jgi:hypothetical protein